MLNLMVFVCNFLGILLKVCLLIRICLATLFRNQFLCSVVTTLCCRIKRYLNIRTAKNYYYSCVYSVIYGLSVWGVVFTCSQSTQALDRHYTRTVSTLFDRFYPSSLCSFKSDKLLKLVDIIYIVLL